ncbi:MAG: FAD:protein FMN transferase [Pedobacter sp.]|nr:FAD:protein FMN transferase [Pedobacter sp.]
MAKLFLLFLMIPLLSLVNVKKTPQEKEWHISGNAQGTTYAITYFFADNVAVKSEADSILHLIDKEMSAYSENSVINRFNASENGVILPTHFKKVVEKSLEVSEKSDGLFDITVAQLVQLWGFGSKKINEAPTTQEIASALQHVGYKKLQLKGNYLIKKDKDLKIDVNGIAQGYTVDVLANWLEKKGIKNYLVELGGEIRVKGRNLSSGKKFQIGIEGPSEESFTGEIIKAKLMIDAGGVTTSGSYRKFYYSDGKKITHLMNPKIGYPLQNEMISATVWANDAITADAYDNVLMAMGIEKSFEFLKKHPDLQAYLIYKKANGIIADTATLEFKKHLIDMKF